MKKIVIDLSNKPVQRAALIFLRYMLAATAILCQTSHFRWLDIVWTNSIGDFEFTFNQTGSFFIFQPPQPGMGSWNQFRTGEYDDESGVPIWDRRLQHLNDLRPSVLRAAGIGFWLIFPPAFRYRFYALYLNHSYFPFFSVVIYLIARFFIRHRATGK